MGAKDWFVCYADGDVREVLRQAPELDRDATDDLVRRLFPDHGVEPAGDTTLGDDPNPEDGVVNAAVWPGATIVCTGEVALDQPSGLDARFLQEGRGRTVHVHAMHSVVDWFAYARWEPDGSLRRALSVNADDQVIEDVGPRLPHEEPFWRGDFPATEDDEEYPLPFHPLELSEATLEAVFGFVFEGHSGMQDDAGLVDPFDVALASYRVVAREQPRRRRLFGRR